MSTDTNAIALDELRQRLNVVNAAVVRGHREQAETGAVDSSIQRGTLENQPVNEESAERLWSEYERAHDVSRLSGKFAGIDPVSGSIWIGKQISDVLSQRNAAGIEAPLYWKRIGCASFAVRVGRKWFRES